MAFSDILNRLSKAALLLGFVVIGLILTVPAQAQETSVKDAKTELKSSLNDLSTLYQDEVQRLEKRQQEAQQLYNDGLISRVELEKGAKALDEARAKVEAVAKEIAAANHPAPTPDALVAELGGVEPPWSTGNNRVDNLIRYYGKQYSVDPYLIYCLMAQESSFTSAATSPKGAQGLMQLMPDTAARYGVTNPYDVAQNIMGGTRYLRDLLKMFNGRVDLALAGYNAGEGAVMKYRNTVPPYDETRNYVRLILKRYGRKQSS
ncbi:MAG TPA: lytic transglycosylase domain-containing protein [Pyrinomonadaceae bacterium]|nr:lytic transglycosylase domain-containing protein [Pyrinomonadaceae bacterium]